MSGKVPCNFSLATCSEDSLKKLLVRDLKAIMNAENLSMHNIRLPSRKKSYIERILKHRDQKKEKEDAMPQKFEHFKAGNAMLVALKQNEENVRKISNKMKGLSMKLSTLQELQKSGMKVQTKTISDALKDCSSQMNAFGFRRLIMTKIINKIKKQELKIAKNQNISTLSDFINQFIRSKEKIMNKHQNNINELEKRLQCLNGDLAQICTIPNEMDIDRMQQIKAEVDDVKRQKETALSALNDIGCRIDAFRTLLSEVLHSDHLIDCNLWIDLASNKRIENAKVTKDEGKTSNKKQKFKFGVSAKRSAKNKTQTLRLCDVLPKNLFPNKLKTTVINNGMMFECTQSLFEMGETADRKQWIESYNNVHLKEIEQRFKSIHGKDIALKRVQFHCISEQSTQMNEDKEDEAEEEEAECINESESEDNQSAKDVVLSAQSISSQNQTQFEGRSKQTLNVNFQKYAPFKPRHQKRHRVRSNKSNYKMGRGETVHVDIESNHPLVASDPFLKAMQNKNKNGNDCLHWVAMGVCGYKERGCRYDHPPQFAANNFMCPVLLKRNECHKQTCAYCHDQTKLPCKDFDEVQLAKWEEVKLAKQKAFEKWVENKTRKGLAKTNEFDETQHNNAPPFAGHDIFESLLTE